MSKKKRGTMRNQTAAQKSARALFTKRIASVKKFRDAGFTQKQAWAKTLGKSGGGSSRKSAKAKPGPRGGRVGAAARKLRSARAAVSEAKRQTKTIKALSAKVAALRMGRPVTPTRAAGRGTAERAKKAERIRRKRNEERRLRTEAALLKAALSGGIRRGRSTVSGRGPDHRGAANRLRYLQAQQRAQLEEAGRAFGSSFNNPRSSGRKNRKKPKSPAQKAAQARMKTAARAYRAGKFRTMKAAVKAIAKGKGKHGNPTAETAYRGSNTVAGHKSIKHPGKKCTSCRGPHSLKKHQAHGKGAHHRVHGGITGSTKPKVGHHYNPKCGCTKCAKRGGRHGNPTFAWLNPVETKVIERFVKVKDLPAKARARVAKKIKAAVRKAGYRGPIGECRVKLRRTTGSSKVVVE